MSGSASTSTYRPSFDSFDAHSEHAPTQDQQHKEQAEGRSAPLQSLHPEEQESAPPYDSSFADTNLSGLPLEALSALSLSRENLDDLRRANFDELDELDRSDDRLDPDAIIRKRITHNFLLARQSAITFASSVYSDRNQQRESLYSTYDYDPTRASVQTYGSSVLTYGSRASQLIDGEDIGMNGGDGSRPVAPLPWLPRPSALDRIQHSSPHLNIVGGRARSGSVGSTSGTGRRPLPPLPTPISATMSTGLSPYPPLPPMRDRSVSLPSRSNSSGSSYSVSSASSAGRRPRPLPRTPTSAVSNNLPDILEGESTEGVPPSSGPMRSNSMFLSPTSSTAPLNLSGRGRRSATFRYSTIGYGQVSRAAAALLRANESDQNGGQGGRTGNGNASLNGLKSYGRTVSRASTRSARSTYLVPDVDELVRILDSMDDGSGSGSSNENVPVTPLAGPWEPKYATRKTDEGEEEIDIGAVLSRSRSVVSVPSSEKRGAASTLEDLRVAQSIGLPTPAATPKSSPHRHPTKLPSSNSSTSSKTPTKASTTASSKPALQVKPVDKEQQSPVPTSADALSLTSFPLPPLALLYIPAPSAVGVGDMPIPSASSGIVPSPSMADFGKSPAERATLPGMVKEEKTPTPQPTTPPRHISAREAIVDLKNRVSELPVFNLTGKSALKKFPGGVPLLGLPKPPRRRAQSVSTGAISKDAPNAKKKQLQPPTIDVSAANALPPPSSFSVGKTADAQSAPAHSLFFNQDKPTVLYTTPAPAPAPSVAPLRIRRTSSAGQTQTSTRAEAIKIQIPPAVDVPQSASALQTTFGATSDLLVSGRAQRATSFCVSPGTPTPAVAPLKLKISKACAKRARSSTVGPVLQTVSKQDERIKSDLVAIPSVPPTPPPKICNISETDASEESESDQLPTPTAANPLVSNGAEPLGQLGNTKNLSVLSCGSSLSALQQATGHASLDPAFADIIKSIAGASEEEQMGSLLTIASSINTEHHASGYNAGFFAPFADASREDDEEFVDIEEEGEATSKRKETVRKSMASGISTSDRRRSKGRSLSSLKKRHSTRSAAAVRAAIRALPDPNTFPIPTSAGSVATNSSALDGGSDYTGFGIRPSPLPKLKVVTKFKGGTVLLPASTAPLSATSTKSSMSTFSGHSRNASGVSIVTKRVSTATGSRKMNRLTLTDPRSPMTDAAVAAATLVARVRQKRAALAARNRSTGINAVHVHNQGQVIHIQRGHARTGSGSSGNALRSKLKMSGSGFFGGY